MNILILVGHPSSGVDGVEVQLRGCGMKEALPSQRDSRLPSDITSALCVAHGVPDFRSVTRISDIAQINPGMVWDGMALDLLLGNVHQNLWGWTDPASVFLLEYWKRLDPRITFILVYQEPASVLADTNQPWQNPADLLANWRVYNSVLLRFFLENSNRCMLVHSRQVHSSMDDHLSQLQNRLQTSPELLVASPVGRETMGSEFSLTHATSPHPAAGMLQEMSGLLNETTRQLAKSLCETPAKNFLSRQLVDQFPECIQLYEELQSVANLPFQTSSGPDEPPIAAWSDLKNQEEFISCLLREIQSKHETFEAEKQQAERERLHLTEQLDLQSRESQSQHEALVWQIQQAEQEKSRLAKLMDLVLAGKGSPSDTLVSGQKGELARKVASVANQLQLARELLDYTRAELETVASEKSALTEVGKCLRRELETAAAEKSALENTCALLTDECAGLATKCEEAVRKEEELILQIAYAKVESAERVKRQLSYQLGNTLVTRSRSLTGWLGMPCAIVSTIRDFHCGKKPTSDRATS